MNMSRYNMIRTAALTTFIGLSVAASTLVQAQTNETAAAAQTVSPIITSLECSEEQAANCLSENRLCYLDACVSCLENFVDWPASIEISNSTNAETGVTDFAIDSISLNDTTCMPIDELRVDLFVQFFQPLWLTIQEDIENNDNPDAALEIWQGRLQTLKNAALFVAAHNRQLPPPSYILTLNEFSADTPEEAQLLEGYEAPTDPGAAFLTYLVAKVWADDLGEAPVLASRVDWVERGAVTSVKDQGTFFTFFLYYIICVVWFAVSKFDPSLTLYSNTHQYHHTLIGRCGGCWSISVSGVIEGIAAIQSNFTYLQSVSFQQLISCDEGNYGCGGGFPAAAIAYANLNLAGGMATLNNYPFTDGEKGETTDECRIDDHEIAVKSAKGQAVTFYGNVGDDSFDIRMQKMKRAVHEQPVAIAMNSECATIKNYKAGVLTDEGDCACGPADIEGCLTHAVLLVGYDDDHSPPFWKIKNSWGTGWGEDGYLRVAQFNPVEPSQNSWGLFGILAEGIITLEAFNRTSQVYDKPQELRDTWETVLIGIAVFFCAACLGIGLVILKNRVFGPGKEGEEKIKDAEVGYGANNLTSK